MERKLIIGFVGAAGTGRTRLAHNFANNYNGIYYSVHKNLCSLLEDAYPSCLDRKLSRDEFTALANKLRKKTRNAAIAVKNIVDTIKAKDDNGLIVIESFQHPAEMAYTEKQLGKSYKIIFIGLMADTDDRLKWMNENPDFLPVEEHNSAFLNAKEFRETAFARPMDENIVACLDKIPQELIFQNLGNGHLGKLYVQIEGNIPW